MADREDTVFESNHEVRKHYQSLQTAVIIPLLQSFITATLVSFSVTVGTNYIGLLGISKALWLGGLTFAITMLVVWWIRIQNWQQLVYQLEEHLHKDIDQDGTIGEPHTVRVEVSYANGRRLQFVDLPITEQQMIDLFPGLAAGIPFSENRWVGPDKPFTREEFRALRDAGLTKGWFAWFNVDRPNQGVRLTPMGHQAVNQVAQHVQKEYGLPTLPSGFTPMQ